MAAGGVRDAPNADAAPLSCGRSRTKGLLMAYELLGMAQAWWRRLNGAHLLPLVRAGIGFMDGVQQASKRAKARARAA